jgi:hypothetical protein
MTAAILPLEGVASVSEQIMPAVRGEFYGYVSEFSVEKPLYFLMKCKSNKARSISTDPEEMLRELDLTFTFGDKVSLCSPNSAPSIGLLGDVLDEASLKRLNQTEIRPNVPHEAFYRCMDARSEAILVETFCASGASETTVLLAEGMTLAIRTASNKYGVVVVRELTSSTCKIEACHILL